MINIIKQYLPYNIINYLGTLRVCVIMSMLCYIVMLCQSKAHF